MNVTSSSALLASTVSLTLAIAMLLKQPRRALYGYFAVFCMALFLWHTATMATDIGRSTMGAWQVGGALLIPPVAILFFRELLRDPRLIGLPLAHAGLFISAVFMVLAFSPWGDSLFIRIPAAIYGFTIFAMLYRALYQHMQHAQSETDKQRLRYLFYGGLIALCLTLLEMLLHTALTAAMAHMADTLYVYFLYQSIIARRLIDLVELLRKAMVLAGMTLVLASIHVLLVVWVGNNQQGLWLFHTLVASFVFLILHDQVRLWIEKITAKLLLNAQYELSAMVHNVLHDLRTTLSLEDMRDRVLFALHNSGRVTHVAMYLETEHDLSFERFGYIGEAMPETLSLTTYPTVIQELRKHRKALLQEHLLHRYQELPTLMTHSNPTLPHELERTAQTIQALESLHATLVIPILFDEHLTGILTLGTEPASGSFTTDEIALLLSLAEACAVVIENSHAYNLRRERDRLVAIGEMAAGMAHEIRNPLGAIKGAAQCLDPQGLPKDAQEFVEVIVQEVDRLNGVVSQFLEYAKPLRNDSVAIDINQVIATTMRLLTTQAIPENITIEQHLAPDLPLVNIAPEQLQQVMINLLLNAVQAMPQGGTLRISSHWVKKNRVCISVQDTGLGIEQNNLTRIFVPFFTTKAQGTGLGLAISQRIVENVGGRLEVASQIGLGTTFSMYLKPANTAVGEIKHA